MATPAPQWNTAVVDDVTDASRSTEIERGKHYRIAATVDVWFKVAATGGSIVAATAAHLLKAGDSVLIYVPASLELYYIRVGSSDGKISIGEVEVA